MIPPLPAPLLEPRWAVADAEPWRSVGELCDEDVEALAETERPEPLPDLLGTFERAGLRPDPAEAGEPLVEKHHIEFLVVDGNGDPFPGLAYALLGPEEREDATLGDDGKLRRDGVQHDEYRLVLKEVLVVRWSAERARAGDEIEIAAAVCGFEDGATATITLFEEWREGDADALATVEATVEAGEVRAVWTYPFDPEDDRDEVRLVAQVTVGEDGPWAKTTTPLAVVLPDVECAAFAAASAVPGAPIGIEVRTVGVADGETVTVQLFHRWRTGETEALDTLDALPVEGGRACAAWTPAGGDDEPGEVATSEAEVFAVATLDNAPQRIAVSDPLWISATAA